MERASRLTLLSVVGVLTVSMPLGPVRAQQDQEEVERLKSEVESQRERIEYLESQLVRHHGPGLGATTPTEPQHVQTGGSEPVTGGDFAGSIRVPGTDLSIRLGGYVKLDGIVDFDPIGSEDLFVVHTISDADDFDTRTRFHAKQTRLSIDAQKPDTPYGAFRVFIEGDFFGSGGDQIVSNSTNFRVRHAYGSLGPLLAGQTWSTFMDDSILPDLLDFQGPVAEISNRQAQIRYTHDFGGGLSLAAALENPETDIRDTRAIATDDPDNGVRLSGVDELPDLVLRARWQRERGHLQSAVLLRRIAVEDGDRGIDDDALGWGVTISGMHKIGEKDHLLAQFNYGEGIARYLVDLGGLGLDAAIEPDGDLEPLTVYGGYVGYQHWWHPRLRSNLVYSRVEVDTRSSQADSTLESSDYAAINLIWSPLPQTNFGIEYLHGRREDKNGDDAKANRLQLSSQLLF